jgi:hypothetical protein
MLYRFRATRRGHPTRAFILNPYRRVLQGQARFLSRAHALRLCEAGLVSAVFDHALYNQHLRTIDNDMEDGPIPVLDHQRLIQHKTTWDAHGIKNWGSEKATDFLGRGWSYEYNPNIKDYEEYMKEQHMLASFNQIEAIEPDSMEERFLSQSHQMRISNFARFCEHWQGQIIRPPVPDVVQPEPEAAYPQRRIRVRRRSWA